MDNRSHGGLEGREADAGKHGAVGPERSSPRRADAIGIGRVLMRLEHRAQASIGTILVVVGSSVRPLLEIMSPDGVVVGLMANILVSASCLALVGVGGWLLVRARALALLLFFATAGCCGLALEGITRVYLFGENAFSSQYVNSMRSFGHTGIARPSPHAGVPFELEADLDELFKGVPFRTNSAGLRDREYARRKAPHVVRIAVVGDSYTLPSGVAIEDAYHSLLEERLNDVGRGSSFELLNFAGAGSDLTGYRSVIRSRALAFDPDMILVGFCAANDADPSPRPTGGGMRPTAGSSKTYPFFFQSFFRTTLRRNVPELLRLAGLRRATTGLSREQSRYLRDEFGRLADLGHAHDLPIVIAYLGNREYDAHTVRGIRRLAHDRGIPFIDTTTAFVGTRLADYAIYHPLDGHPNARAHEAFARVILESLVHRGLLPSRLP